jgi:hypothetical protein
VSDDSATATGQDDKPKEAVLPTQDSAPDDALILWMLSLTPAERLAVAQGFAESVHALRNGERS